MKYSGCDEQDRVSKAIVSQMVGEVLSTKIILCELREGTQAAAIEALESSIDATICMIWRKTINANDALREMGLNALTVI